MKIIRNDKLISRNAKIGQYVTIGALALIVIIIYLGLTAGSRKAGTNELIWMFALVILTFILVQASTYLGPRFNRSPRLDEAIDAALKGIPGEYTAYHYSAPVSHLVTGPCGVWILLPYHQKGKITFRKNRWRLGGGGAMQMYLRLFGMDGIGRPDLEAEGDVSTMGKFFKKAFGEGAPLPPLHVALVFIDPEAEIDCEDAPIPTMHAKKLKEFLRKYAKENPLAPADLQKIQAVLAAE